jgi:outer membrane lipoprotein
MNRVRFPKVFLIALLAALLAACASEPPLKTEGVDKGLTPNEAATGTKPGARVLWGGVIVASTNLKEETQIEVLGFPLGDDQQPKTDDKPLGRFVVLHPGYLETADYASGRRITVVGSLTGTRPGRIGESDYTYPVVKPDRIHLWPRDSARQSTEPRFHFGVGVIFH